MSVIQSELGQKGTRTYPYFFLYKVQICLTNNKYEAKWQNEQGERVALVKFAPYDFVQAAKATAKDPYPPAKSFFRFVGLLCLTKPHKNFIKARGVYHPIFLFYLFIY